MSALVRVAEWVRGPGRGGDPGVKSGKFYRSRGGVWLPRAGIFATRFNVLAVLRKVAPDGTVQGLALVPGINIVTNEGDKYYAQQAAGEAPTNDFDADAARMGMCGTGTTAVAKTDKGLTTPVAGSNKTQATGYPKTNDTDADNTGAGVDIVTWLHSYTKADFNANNIAEFAIGIDKDADSDISNDGPSTDVALMHALFAATFNKTADDTLKVFVNHTFNGV